MLEIDKEHISKGVRSGVDSTLSSSIVKPILATVVACTTIRTQKAKERQP
jgi:predicted PP-loop superfamily ATPase